MAKQPTFRLLGKNAKQRPTAPSAKTIDTFPNRSPGRDYWITFASSEFTSVCPVTGQADFADIEIRYVPDRLCIETKSLKFYLASYRQQASFNEEIVNRILDDLVAACSPRRMEVCGEFTPRGGIGVRVEAIMN